MGNKAESCERKWQMQLRKVELVSQKLLQNLCSDDK
jgi:hypothetical protein